MTAMTAQRSACPRRAVDHARSRRFLSCATMMPSSSQKENPGMFKVRVVLFLLVIVCGKAWALNLNEDEFAGIKCGADIPKSLLGKRDSSERVVVLEGRHKDLGLKNLGGTEVSDRLFLASWQICGSEYELLVNTKTGLIRDVLPFPRHSAASPMFIAACQADGKEGPRTVVA